MPEQAELYLVRKLVGGKVFRTHVHRRAQPEAFSGPCRELGQDVIDDPQREQLHDAARLGGQDHVGGVDQPALGVPPPNQRLDADQSPVLDPHLRLVKLKQLAGVRWLLDRGAEVHE